MSKVKGSSNIKSIDVAPEGGVIVEFTSGKTYHYPDCPHELVDKVASAPSVGGAFHDLIRSQYRGVLR